jgi:hypothetical protein
VAGIEASRHIEKSRTTISVPTTPIARALGVSPSPTDLNRSLAAGRDASRFWFEFRFPRRRFAVRFSTAATEIVHHGVNIAMELLSVFFTHLSNFRENGIRCHCQLPAVEPLQAHV